MCPLAHAIGVELGDHAAIIASLMSAITDSVTDGLHACVSMVAGASATRSLS
jgi:hypothetical protein